MPRIVALRCRLLGLALLLASASPGQAADGFVDFSWDDCSPVIQDKTTSTPGPIALYISVLGIDVPQQGYETTFIYGDANGNVPDAWRFDPPGCQGSAYVTINHLEIAKSCPSFQGTLASVQVKDVALVPPTDPFGYSTNMRVSLFNAYPNGGAGITPLIGTRYFLERVLFDHTYSVAGETTPGVDCGGWETPMCFRITRAYYLDLAGQEVPFGRNVPLGAPLLVTFNGLAPPGNCGGVPARAATWGAIKHQYR